MTDNTNTKTLLDPFRVLDLTNERGGLCGRVLGDMGADVIKIEKPGGDPSRRIGPYYKDIPDPEKSLFWWAFNGNKRGITLNIEVGQGREIFERLVTSAHFVIESFDPGYMDKRGLGYAELSALNPRIIVTSITPFGQKGPYAACKASDLVVQSMGGQVFIAGDADRPPVQIGFPVSYSLAGLEAAAGSLIAHYYRETTGQGQHIDVSMQQTIAAWSTYEEIDWWQTNRIQVPRMGTWRLRPFTNAVYRMTWPCKNGFAAYTIMGGIIGAVDMKRLSAWIQEEGMATDLLVNMNWEALDMAKATQDVLDKISEPIGRFFLSHTKEELYDGAGERKIRIYPVATTKDVLDDSQLRARHFWVDVEHPELGITVTYPGPWAVASKTPLIFSRRAPLIGEHNEDIYTKELGYTSDELSSLRESGVI